MVLKASRKDEPKQATIEQDATVVESHKEQSRMTYLGERGYQPVINYWVEQDLILADEFRDGNVPAGMDCLTSLLRAVRERGEGPRRTEERWSGRGDAVWEVLRQRGVVAAQLSLLQRDLDHEEKGFAEKLLAGADERG